MSDCNAPPFRCSELGRRLLLEQAEWRDFVEQTWGRGAVLIHVGLSDNDRRVYRVGNRVAKVVRRRGSQKQLDRWSGQELEHEFQIMRKLEAAGYQLAPSLSTAGDWQILTARFVEGESFDVLWKLGGPIARMRLLLAAIAAVERAHGAGIWHGDLRGDNLIVGRRAELVDWGSAGAACPVIARIRECAELTFGRNRRVQRWLKRALLRSIPGAGRLYRRVKMGGLDAAPRMDVADESAAARLAAPLTRLERAWKSGARWCEELGRPLPITSLTVAGVHFPGQRSLLLEWDCLSQVLNLRAKRVVDIGCDLGLLTSLVKLGGADSALGVETQRRLTEAARDVAEALGARAAFQTVSTIEELSESAGIRDVDIAIALSGAARLGPKPALLEFLGRFPEVIYEASQPLEVECRRLRDLGFREVDVVMDGFAGPLLLYGHRN